VACCDAARAVRRVSQVSFASQKLGINPRIIPLTQPPPNGTNSMKYILFLVLIAAAQAALHALVSWQIALVVPCVAVFCLLQFNITLGNNVGNNTGNNTRKQAWILAAAASALAWLALYGLNFIFAADAASRAVSTIAGIVGGGAALPAFVLPLASTLVAAIAGALAGLVGAGVQGLVYRD
jgi:hypothetical protein